MSHVGTLNMSRLCMTACRRPMPRLMRPLARPRDSRKATMTKKQRVKSSAQITVLVKVCRVEGQQKLGDKWESRSYIVAKKQPSTPVYVVRSENGDRERVVHRNLLT